MMSTWKWYALDLVKNDTGRLVDSEQPNNCRQKGDRREELIVRGGQVQDIVVRDSI